MKAPLDRPTLLRLAGEAELDPRTVKRAVEHGLASLHGEAARNRLRTAAKKLGVKLTE